MSKNKIKYGLKNVHVAILTKTLTDGEYSYSYATPVSIPGAVNLSLDAQGESSPFYADDITYFRATTNNGYSGDLEMALVTDWFRENILKETRDSNGILIERSTDIDPVYFALLFEFSGDNKATRHVLYNCSVSTRPTLEGQTKEDSITPGTETLSISADPREDGLVKARTGDSTSDAAYNSWYTTVYVPDSATEAATLTALSIGSLTLTPTFSAGTVAYTTTTENESDTVTATGESGSTVIIKVNGAAANSGGEATWNDGSNTVQVTVSKSGKATTTYAVTVMKAAG